MDMQPSARQRDLIEQARRLALDRFAPRADQLDREAAFPFDDYDDLRDAGFLALCVPERFGGLGADFETYCLVSEQIARGNASTALTFNMHCLTMLMMGEMANRHPMDEAARAVVEVTQEAIRVCGGRAILKRFPLERYARDARAAAVMRPWTQDIATEEVWKRALKTQK